MSDDGPDSPDREDRDHRDDADGRPRHMAPRSRRRWSEWWQSRSERRRATADPDTQTGAGRDTRPGARRDTGASTDPGARPSPDRDTQTGADRDTGPSADPDRGRVPARASRLPSWAVPVALAGAGLAAAAASLALDGEAAASALGDPEAATPVLSARRAPELIASPVGERRLAGDLEAWMAQSPPSSCLVVEASDDTLYAHNPTLPLAGASTQKLVTATALLLAMGPEARLETVVGAAAPPAGGIVAGDLYLVGGGDPLLATPGYAAILNRNDRGLLTVDPVELVDAIAAAGVTRIEGSVVGDDTRYDQERYNPAWPARFRAQAVVGPVSALTINDGFGFYLAADQGPGPGATLDPATNAAAIVTELLRQRGIAVGGQPRAGAAPEGLTSIATFPSRTVRELVAEMLTDSDNDTAEMALKELGATVSGSGTWAAGVEAARSVLAEAGVDLEGVDIVDGSGLSDAGRLNCQLLVDLLTLPETGPILVEGLAVAGESGTLADRWDGTPVEGRLRAKTGTLNTVTALSGRVDPLPGGSLTFAYVLNVAAPSTVSAADVARQDELADILVNYPRDVDVSQLLPAPPAAIDAG